MWLVVSGWWWWRKFERQSRGTARAVKTRGMEICSGLLVSSILISLTASGAGGDGAASIAVSSGGIWWNLVPNRPGCPVCSS